MANECGCRLVIDWKTRERVWLRCTQHRHEALAAIFGVTVEEIAAIEAQKEAPGG